MTELLLARSLIYIPFYSFLLSGLGFGAGFQFSESEDVHYGHLLFYVNLHKIERFFCLFSFSLFVGGQNAD